MNQLSTPVESNLSTAQPGRSRFQVAQIPLSLNNVIDVDADSIEAVRAWALCNVDTRTRWIIKQDGRNVGEAIVVVRYKFSDYGMRPIAQTFNSTARRFQYFETPEEAIADYHSHLDEATRQLDTIEQRVAGLMTELSCHIGHVIDGDTHGIHEDYQYVSVNIGGYEYRRKL